jgi:hypothetical protein
MKCPRCSGFVHKEGLVGSSPPNEHCFICGWRQWEGLEVRQPKKAEVTVGIELNPGLSNKKKKKVNKLLKKLLLEADL